MTGPLDEAETEVDAVVWDEASAVLYQALIEAWPPRTIGPGDPKLPLVRRALPRILGWCFAHHPDVQLLTDARALALAHDQAELAHRLDLAIVAAQALVHPRPKRWVVPPTPAWYRWLVEKIYAQGMEHEPDRVVRRLRQLADDIENRTRPEYRSMELPTGEPFRKPSGASPTRARGRGASRQPGRSGTPGRGS